MSKAELMFIPEQFAAAKPRMDYQLLYVDQEMREFLSKNLSDGAPEAKLRKLLRAMSKRGLGHLNYNLDLTYTAQDTFHKLEGNCLSFTNLFVALAREAGLKVFYQMVEVPPNWDGGEGGLVILNNHVNVIVKLRYKMDRLVDFNLFEYQDNYTTKAVSDEYAESMFYSNLGVEALQRKEYGNAFWYLNHALALYPDIDNLWVNLGVLFSRVGMTDHAESAYLQSLLLERGNKSALSNLAGLYYTQGDVEKAEAYKKMVSYYRNTNPYYHFSLANIAFDQGNYQETLTLISRSIRLKQVEHQFHYLKGKALKALGKDKLAIKSLEKAHRYAVYYTTREKYARELEAAAG
ncbi:MAG: tetratricopeptide repeat protein [Pseudomonadales bacterium]|nr:tetratricopeptide repeat protein [Pseudomonadales bacterium]